MDPILPRRHVIIRDSHVIDAHLVALPNRAASVHIETSRRRFIGTARHVGVTAVVHLAVEGKQRTTFRLVKENIRKNLEIFLMKKYIYIYCQLPYLEL